MATPLMALHVAAHRERLSTPSVRAAERLLTSVTVRVNPQARRPRKGLVAGAADVPVVVLLVRSSVRGREVVVVLPGRVDGRDHLLRCCCCCRHGGRGHGGRSWSGVIVDCGSGGGSRSSGGGSGGSGSDRSRGLNGRRGVGHAGSGRGVRTSLDGALAGDGGAVRRAGESDLVDLVADGGDRGRVAGPVEGRARAQWRSRRQADRNAGHDGLVGPGLRTRVRRAHSLAFCGLLVLHSLSSL